MSNPRQEAEKIARELIEKAYEGQPYLYVGHALMLTSDITSALLEAEERGADKERRIWLDHLQTFGPMLARARDEGVLDTLITANLWPVPVSDEDVIAVTKEAIRIRSLKSPPPLKGGK